MSISDRMKAERDLLNDQIDQRLIEKDYIDNELDSLAKRRSTLDVEIAALTILDTAQEMYLEPERFKMTTTRMEIL